MVFDYRALRLLVGIIALALPTIVTIVSQTELISISASYYTEARDEFVGLLFVVGAFLWAYNGRTHAQGFASKIASISAISIALFPTACEPCKAEISSLIHSIAALTLFSTLSYFCFVYFRQNTKGKGGKKGLRSKIYFFCGSLMIACILIIVYVKLMYPSSIINELRVVYWAESVALSAFGIAWIVAGKYFRLLVDAEEELKLFFRKI